MVIHMAFRKEVLMTKSLSLSRVMVIIRRDKFGGFRFLASIQSERIESKPPVLHVLHRGTLTLNLATIDRPHDKPPVFLRFIPGVFDPR